MEKCEESHCSSIESYECLANAIILQAVEEYRAAIIQIKENPQNNEMKNEVLRIERFFRSGWFSVLTSIDGEYLIRMLKAEIGND